MDYLLGIWKLPKSDVCRIFVGDFVKLGRLAHVASVRALYLWGCGGGSIDEFREFDILLSDTPGLVCGQADIHPAKDR